MASCQSKDGSELLNCENKIAEEECRLATRTMAEFEATPKMLEGLVHASSAYAGRQKVTDN